MTSARQLLWGVFLGTVVAAIAPPPARADKAVSTGASDGAAKGEAAARDQWISHGIGASALGGGGVLYSLGVKKASDAGVTLAPLPRGARWLARGRF